MFRAKRLEHRKGTQKYQNNSKTQNSKIAKLFMHCTAEDKRVMLSTAKFISVRSDGCEDK